MRILTHFIKEALLTEKIFGAQAFVYHGSKLEPDRMQYVISTDSFYPGNGAGAMYGHGLYSVYGDPDSHWPTFNGAYGKYVYKLKVSLHGFIVFDAIACQKIYGKTMTVLDQLMMLGYTDAITDIKRIKNTREIASAPLNPDEKLSSIRALPLSKYLANMLKESFSQVAMTVTLR